MRKLLEDVKSDQSLAGLTSSWLRCSNTVIAPLENCMEVKRALLSLESEVPVYYEYSAATVASSCPWMSYVNLTGHPCYSHYQSSCTNTPKTFAQYPMIASPATVSIILKQNTNALPMMHAPNRLGEDIANLEHFQLLASRQVLILRHAVGHHHFVQATGVNSVDRVTGEDPMRHQRIDARGTGFFYEFSCTSDSVACVGEIIDQDRAAIRHRADEQECGVLTVGELRWSSFLRASFSNTFVLRTELVGVPCESTQNPSLKHRRCWSPASPRQRPDSQSHSLPHRRASVEFDAGCICAASGGRRDYQRVCQRNLGTVDRASPL